MPYVIGIVLSLSVALFANRVGFDRDRAFYPTVLIVIALYYVLFAAMSESLNTVFLESIVMTGFSIAAASGSSRVRGSLLVGWPLTAFLMPFTAMSWKTPGCQSGGQPFVSRMTSEPQVALPGS